MKRQQKFICFAITVGSINLLALANLNLKHYLSYSTQSTGEIGLFTEKLSKETTTEELQNIEHARNDSVIFTSVLEAHAYMWSKKNIRTAKRIIVEYADFPRRYPNFYNDHDKSLFLKSRHIQESLLPNHYQQLRGVVEIVRNGTFQMEYSCGYNSDVRYLEVARKSSHHFHILVPLIVPMAFLFQHFLDGTMPKIVQALPFILRKDAYLLLEYPIHNVVYEFLSKSGISKDKIVWHNRGDIQTVYSADYLVFACVAPPVHPDLWKLVRTTIGVNNHLEISFNTSYVVLLTRTGASNTGRSMTNFEEVKLYLSKRYKGRFRIFYSAPSLTDCLEIFGRAGIIIGTHGGAFYNMYFAPLDTHIVEVSPVLPGGRDIRGLPHGIFWASADMIGQTYWRIPTFVANYINDMHVNLTKLVYILDQIDASVM